jgi:uncharacterized protein (TIGR02246 family)
MKPVYPIIGLALLGACLSARAQEEGKPGLARPATAQETSARLSSAPAADRRDDERAVGALVEAFIRAFNGGDAAAAAATFTKGAVVVDEKGERAFGQAAIGDQFAASFKDNPGSTIAIEVKSLRFLGRETALEEGRAIITPAKGPTGPPRSLASPPSTSRKTAAGFRPPSATSRRRTSPRTIGSRSWSG